LVGDEQARLLAAAQAYGGEIGPLTWAIETAVCRREIGAMRSLGTPGPPHPFGWQ
jgi:hypothetical protein